MSAKFAAALVKLAIVIAGCAIAAGCAQNPWVKPYERDALNDPLLNTQSDSLPGRQRENAIAVRQGARGAVGLPGDGCGCD